MNEIPKVYYLANINLDNKLYINDKNLDIVLGNIISSENIILNVRNIIVSGDIITHGRFSAITSEGFYKLASIQGKISVISQDEVPFNEDELLPKIKEKFKLEFVKNSSDNGYSLKNSKESALDSNVSRFFG